MSHTFPVVRRGQIVHESPHAVAEMACCDAMSRSRPIPPPAGFFHLPGIAPPHQQRARGLRMAAGGTGTVNPCA